MSRRVHTLKVWPEPYAALANGTKRFEWRKDDRDFEVGDMLELRRYDPETDEVDPERFIRVLVTYILRGAHGVPDGFCVMSVELWSGG